MAPEGVLCLASEASTLVGHGQGQLPSFALSLPVVFTFSGIGVNTSQVGLEKCSSWRVLGCSLRPPIDQSRRLPSLVLKIHVFRRAVGQIRFRV